MTDEEKAAIEFLKQNEKLSLKAFTFDQLSEQLKFWMESMFCGFIELIPRVYQLLIKNLTFYHL